MNRVRNVGLVLGLVGATAMAPGAYAKDAPHAEIGKKAPDFKLKSSDGKEYALSNFKGKVVVLEWTNHQCPVVGRYVIKQKTMQNTQSKFAQKDVVWLSIDSSHFCEKVVDDINKFREKNGLGYPTLLDPDGKVGRRYGAKTTPHMFVIDSKGSLVYAGSMDNDRYGDTDNPRHYVSEAIDALLAGSAVPVSKTKPFGCSVKYK